MEFDVLAGRLGILQTIAIIAQADGQPTRAAELAGAVEALRGDSKVMLPPIKIIKLEDPALGARAALGEAAFEAAWDRGQEMSMAETAALAQEVLEGAR
jgi:hypothetical protein